jgi:predicted transcriptional regulator
LELYRKILRQAELPGLSPLAVRQTVATRLYERGADEEQVGLLLGVSDKAAVKEQFPRPKRSMQDLVRD